MKQRIKYFDYTKGLAMILVMYCHYFTVADAPLRKFFYVFHLPVFFIVSGMLLKIKKNINIKSQFKKLMKPYFVFCIFNIILLFIYDYIFKLNYYENLLYNIKSTIMFNGIKATWFLPCLFLAMIMFNFLNSNVKNRKKLFFIIALLSLIPFINISFQNIYFYEILMRSIIAMVFIFVGYFSFEWFNNEKINLKFLVFSLIFVLLIAYFCDNIDLYYLKLVDPICYYIGGIMGSYLILSIFKFFDKHNIKLRFVEFVGKNSLIFLGTHMVVGYYVKKSLQILLNQDIIFSNLYLQGVIILIVALIIEIPVVYIFNKILRKSSR